MKISYLKNKHMKNHIIGIFGQGFVGSAVFSKFKKFYKVLTYDLDSTKCNSSEEDLLNQCDIIFVCLPTPMNQDGSCNINIVESVINKINSKCNNKIIIIKSTVSPNTTKQLGEKYKNNDIVFNPEFLTERNAIQDYENQKRIILGGPKKATTVLKNIFSVTFPEADIIKTDSTYAELVKYLTNTFLSVKVSFANEMYNLCKNLDVDYDKIIEYAKYDKRLGDSHWTVPGPDGDFGFGGHCFPKDLSEIIHLTNKLGSINNVLIATLNTNNKVRENRDWETMKGRAVI